MKINLKKLGIHDPVKPKSMATCSDFVMIWGSGGINQAQSLRLSAAAIAVCLDGSRVLPAYNIKTGDPIEFGHKVLDRLFAAGLTFSEVASFGSHCLALMVQGIDFLNEVEEKENFTGPTEED